MEPVASARIPIVKSQCAHTAIKVDVCFDAASGSASSATVTEFLRLHPEVRPLVMVLKHMLHQRDLQETYTGGLGSFLLTVMVTFHVARLKNLAYTVDPKHHKQRTKAVRAVASQVEKEAAGKAATPVDEGSTLAASVRGDRAEADVPTSSESSASRSTRDQPPVLAVVDEPLQHQMHRIAVPQGASLMPHRQLAARSTRLASLARAVPKPS